MSGESSTKYDQFCRYCKSHPILFPVLIFFVVIVSLGTLANSLDSISSFVKSLVPHKQSKEVIALTDVLSPKAKIKTIDELVANDSIKENQEMVANKEIASITDAAIKPIKEELEKNVKKYDLLNKIYELETLALNDDRSAFQELQKLAKSDSQVSKIALVKVNTIERKYDLLKDPLRFQLSSYAYPTGEPFLKLMPTLGLAEILRFVSSTSLKESELGNAMEAVKYKVEAMRKGEEYTIFLKFLKESNSLTGSVLVCAVLSREYLGGGMTIFAFDKWIDFLNEQLIHFRGFSSKELQERGGDEFWGRGSYSKELIHK